MSHLLTREWLGLAIVAVLCEDEQRAGVWCGLPPVVRMRGCVRAGCGAASHLRRGRADVRGYGLVVPLLIIYRTRAP